MRRRHHKGMAALSLGALGIVFGDIGTSPLYALQTVFAADQHAVRPTESGVYGVISLVFWAVTIIVSIKYVVFIMRADNDGEGGIMALIALIRNVGLKRRWAQVVLIALGIFGASLFYGDGMITPAISVLSAVEGIEVVEPSLHSLVVPIALVILTLLFAAQRFGTGAVGRLFGPVMAVWFTILAVAGLHEVVKEPEILKAISPSYAVTLHVRARPRRVHRARLRRAHRHGRRGALRGHGPLRARADPARVVRRRLPRPDPQLHGPGGADPAHAERDREPVLPAVPGLEPDPDGACSPRSRP